MARKFADVSEIGCPEVKFFEVGLSEAAVFFVVVLLEATATVFSDLGLPPTVFLTDNSATPGAAGVLRAVAVALDFLVAAAIALGDAADGDMDFGAAILGIGLGLVF